MPDDRDHSPAPESTRTDVDRGRRGVLGAVAGSAFGLGLAALGAAGGLWTAVTGRFLLPNVVTEPPCRFKVGFPGEYAPGYVETRFKEGFGVFVVRGTYRGKPQIFALRPVCTHLGCIVIWQDAEEKFQCPCHGSAFSHEGINLEGPAPRPLERHAIRLADDGQLEVDTSKLYQEELGQWDDPACYVSV